MRCGSVFVFGDECLRFYSGSFFLLLKIYRLDFGFEVLGLFLWAVWFQRDLVVNILKRPCCEYFGTFKLIACA